MGAPPPRLENPVPHGATEFINGRRIAGVGTGRSFTCIDQKKKGGGKMQVKERREGMTLSDFFLKGGERDFRLA